MLRLASARNRCRVNRRNFSSNGAANAWRCWRKRPISQTSSGMRCSHRGVKLKTSGAIKRRPELTLRILLRQRTAFRFRGKPDQDKSDHVNQRDHSARLAIIAIVELHQVAHLQGANRREDAPEVIADPL